MGFFWCPHNPFYADRVPVVQCLHLGKSTQIRCVPSRAIVLQSLFSGAVKDTKSNKDAPTLRLAPFGATLRYSDERETRTRGVDRHKTAKFARCVC